MAAETKKRGFHALEKKIHDIEAADRAEEEKEAEKKQHASSGEGAKREPPKK